MVVPTAKANKELADKITDLIEEVDQLKKANGLYAKDSRKYFDENTQLREKIKTLSKNRPELVISPSNAMKSDTRKRAPKISYAEFKHTYIPEILKMIQEGKKYHEIDAHFEWKSGYLKNRLSKYKEVRELIKKAAAKGSANV